MVPDGEPGGSSPWQMDFGASLCVLVPGCICTLASGDPSQWSGPLICSYLWLPAFFVVVVKLLSLLFKFDIELYV